MSDKRYKITLTEKQLALVGTAVEGMMNDLISRKALCDYALNQKDKSVTPNDIMRFPSAQPERTCVNCGRTINNGGWYADGRTRCPIEEHYALPKDGYCHLWEKRNVADDDCPERRTDE